MLKFPNKKATPKLNIDAAVRQGEFNVRVERLASAVSAFIALFVPLHRHKVAGETMALIVKVSRDLGVESALTDFDARFRKCFSRAYLAGVFMGVVLALNAVFYGAMIGKYFGQYIPF